LTINPTTVSSPPAARSLREILGAARMINCAQCWQAPGQPCAHSTAGSHGIHVARLARAFRRGLVSGPELITVLQAVVCFTLSTVVYQDQPADAPDDETCPRCRAISWGMTPDGIPQCTRCRWPGAAR
jgi:hypothetical protein